MIIPVKSLENLIILFRRNAGGFKYHCRSGQPGHNCTRNTHQIILNARPREWFYISLQNSTEYFKCVVACFESTPQLNILKKKFNRVILRLYGLSLEPGCLFVLTKYILLLLLLVYLTLTRIKICSLCISSKNFWIKKSKVNFSQ